MALSKNDEQLLELLLKERSQSVKRRNHKPMHIRVLQLSMVFLSLVLFIVVGSLGILALTKPESAAAANTYTETWSATNGVYTEEAANGINTYKTGLPANGTITNNTNAGTNNWNTGFVVVTAWTVSGTVN